MSWALGMVACGILREAGGGSATSTVCLPGHVPVSVPFYNNFHHLRQSKHDGPHTACRVRLEFKSVLCGLQQMTSHL